MLIASVLRADERAAVRRRKLQLLEKDNKRETKDNESDRAVRAESALPNG